jgi:hypothetical protein
LGHLVSEAASAVVVLAVFAWGARALAGRAMGRGRTPRVRMRGGRGGGIVAGLARAAGRVVALAGRFVAGAPLGRRRTDATFLSRGTRAVAGMPGWLGRAEPGRWAYLPGWKRAAVRLGVLGAAVGLWLRPLWTGAVLGWLAAISGGVAVPRLQRWRYVRAVVRPVYLQLCQYLGTDPADRPDRWLHVPPGFRSDPEAAVTLVYPPTWSPDAARQRAVDELVRRHLGGNLVPHFGALRATWQHPPAPPRLAPFAGHELPAHRIHMATLAGGRHWVADLEAEEPHMFIAAGTGGGKTSAVSIPAAHTRAHGWLVDILDPKRRSYIDRETGQDVLTDVPGIRVHTDVESMMWALEEFFLSMLGANMAIGAKTARPEDFPSRLLVIDEFGTFASMIGRAWRRAGGKGTPPALDQRRQIEWQGREAGHRLVLAVHQPNLSLFGDSDSRGQYGYRLVTGAYTASLWRMAFGFAPRVEWDGRVKGRGVVGVGEAEELIHEAQLVWLPEAERRAYALTGPPPPQWHAEMQPAPWITPDVLAEGRKLAGVSLVAVPAGTATSVPAETPGPVPVTVPPSSPAGRPEIRREKRPEPGKATAEMHLVVNPDDELIVGIAAGARYLGYEKAESFRRARTRHPIPGERRTDDGRPSWTPQALRDWQSKRKIAGGRERSSSA